MSAPLSWPEALERIAQLETLCGLNWQAPIEFGLTPVEHSFMGLLMRAPGVLDRERAFELLYWDRADTMAGAKGLDTLVCKLRPKLRAFGIEIVTSHGRGWYLSSEAKGLSASATRTGAASSRLRFTVKA